MKRRLPSSITFVILLCISCSVFSQSKVRGNITDINGNPIAAATVLLLNSADSALVKGTVTNNSGQYSFENVAAGIYFISTSFVGYSPASMDKFQVVSNNENIDRGSIKMEPLPTGLNNVTVTAKKPLYEQNADRLTINVAASITSAGNTALQVLERSPGVMVNRQSNTISIQGKDGVNIMINGKMTYMPAAAVMQMLDGMSAGNIEKIELITTPPANFDAEGKAGYINIVLKENNNVGTNGSFSGTIGYGKGWVTQANLNFNHRQGKFSIYGDFSYSRVKSQFPGHGYNRITNNGIAYETYRTIDRMDTTRNHNARLGLDYQVSNRTVVGILLTSNGRWYRQAETTTAAFHVNGNLDTTSNNFNTELNNWQDYGVNLNLQHNFANDATLSVNGYYLHYENNQPFNYYARYYDKIGTFAYDERYRNGKVTPLNFWIGAIDYTRKLSRKVDLETGIKGTITDFTNQLHFETLNQGAWTTDPSLSSEYMLKENYSAVYASLNAALNDKTTLKGGLRYEYTHSNLGTVNEKNLVTRDYGKLFPTLFFSHKINDKSSFNLSYSSRITRPTFNDLAPFTYYSSRTSVLTGNPALQPAIYRAFSGGYTYKRYSFQVSAGKEDHAIVFFQPSVDSTTQKTISKSENLVNQKLVSIVISVPVTVTSWWTMIYNITGNWNQSNAVYKGTPLRVNQKNFGLNMTQSFILPKDYSIELSGFYQSRALNGVSEFKPFGSLDFGARKKFNARNALNFSASNLLNSMDFRGSTNFPSQNLVSEINLRFAWRTYKLTYTHNFGKTKLKETRSRKTGAEDEAGRVKYN